MFAGHGLDLGHADVALAARQVALHFDALREVFGNVIVFDVGRNHHFVADLQHNGERRAATTIPMDEPSSRRAWRSADERTIATNRADAEFH
jgi:hypothetical protein